MTERNQYTSTNVDLNNDSNNSNELQEPTIFGFKGRIGRVRYIAYSMLGTIAFYFAFIIPGILVAISPAIGGILMFVMIIAFIVLAFSWPIRRLHDLNHSGWLVLLQLIPIVNVGLFLYMLFAPGTQGQNNYGNEPTPNSTGVIVAACLVPVLFVAMIGVLAAVAIPAYADYVEKAEAAAMQMEESDY